jgi:6-phosphogluconolactonase (cycloisomerase 2 family)
MKPFSRLAAASSLAIAIVVSLGTPALAHSQNGSRHEHDRRHVHNRGHHSRGAHQVVFVQTDDPAGNSVVAYDRAKDGTLTEADTYPTGGLGGVLTGSVVDHLASQDSLTYDAKHALLFAVNAGSNTVSVFSVHDDQLTLREIVPSFGAFPVSIAVHDDLVYVLNALDGGSVQGYRIRSHDLDPIDGSSRALGLDPSATPQFVNTPGQVAFSPDGSQLIITTKANGSAIDVFRVQRDGTLSDAPVVNAEPGTVPFAVTFDRDGHLVVTEAGTNALATFDLHGDGTITLLQAVPTGQAATCWVVGSDGQFYVSNAGSASLSRFDSGHHGTLTFLDNTTTDAGTVDAAVSANGRYLYVQAGASGIVDEFRINADGSLVKIGSVTVPNAVGGEGIVAV